MTKKQIVLSCAAALAVSVSAIAQSSNVAPPVPAATAPAGSGLLGQRYVDASFGFVDINHSRVDAYATGVNVNLPVATNVDVGLSYAYAWAEGMSEIDNNLVAADVTGYFATGAIKPFGTLSLGYNWADGDDYAVWGADAGVEFELSPVASLVASLGYSDDFESGDNGTWSASVGGRYWFTPTLAAKTELSYLEGGSFGYAVGVLLKF